MFAFDVESSSPSAKYTLRRRRKNVALRGLFTSFLQFLRLSRARKKQTKMSTEKIHSIKVPTQYKRVAAVLKTALESKKSLKTLMYNEKHAVSLISLENNNDNECTIIVVFFSVFLT